MWICDRRSGALVVCSCSEGAKAHNKTGFAPGCASCSLHQQTRYRSHEMSSDCEISSQRWGTHVQVVWCSCARCDLFVMVLRCG